jgi:hypothetical protein
VNIIVHESQFSLRPRRFRSYKKKIVIPAVFQPGSSHREIRVWCWFGFLHEKCWNEEKGDLIDFG